MKLTITLTSWLAAATFSSVALADDHEVSGFPARNLFSMLSDVSYLTMVDGLVGVQKLEADVVLCRKVLGAYTDSYACEVTRNGATATVNGNDAAVAWYVLHSFGGEYDQGTIGAELVRATDVSCSRPVVPNPRPTCELTTGD